MRKVVIRKARPDGGRWRLTALCGVAAVLAVGLWLGLRKNESSNEPQVPQLTEEKVKPRNPRPTTGKRTSPREVNKPQPKAVVKEALAGSPPETIKAAEMNVPIEEAERPVRKEPLFKHGTEQLLALATPAEPGMSVPPLPKITDESVAEDLAKAMQDTIRPTTNDTERTLEMKLNVAQQKEEFRELRDRGMTFVEYVNALREKFNEDAAYLAEARKLDESLFNDKEISDKDYKAYRAELNKSLRERGLPELEAR